MPSLDSSAARTAAAEALVEGFYANSSRGAQNALWKTIGSALEKWCLKPFPPTRDTLVALGATLKAGNYASAENYLVHYRVRCERAGFSYTPTLTRLHIDIVRSCKRGLGGPTKALALPLLRLGELDAEDDDPWVQGGPVGPACAIIAGAWFLTREVELATSRACLTTLERSHDGSAVVRWSLPASKTDCEARGVARSHGCNCDGSPGASCPYHAVERQLDRLRRLFPERWSDEGPHADLPLFPTADGEAVAKERMVATILAAAKKLQVPLTSADRSARVSGHSLRVTGAQGLARAGVDVWAIQLLGRWGSSAVLEYIREVPLELSSSWAARAAKMVTLDDKLKSRTLAPSTASSSSPSFRASGPSSSSVAPPALGLGVSVPALEDAMVEAENALIVESTPLSACKFLSSDSGKWHRLSGSGLAGVSSGWSAACGWRFAGALASLAEELPPNLCHKWFCAKCFPEHRARLKQSA